MRHSKKRLNVFVGLAVLSLGVACTAQSAPEAQIEAVAPSDGVLSRSIAADLAGLPGVDPSSVTVTVNGGVAELSGRVANLPARRLAAETARGIRGVRAVVDRLSVAAPIPPSAELTRRIARTMEADPAVDERTVTFTVTGGTVTLSGRVARMEDRLAAEETVAGVRGVGEIVNDIAIVNEGERSDAEIEGDVKGRLSRDARLYDDAIAVHVTEGAVSLIGNVGSAAEFRRAFERSWVPGARSVDATDLNVVSWLDDDPNKGATSPPSASDESIGVAVARELSAHPRVGPGLNVSVADGVAALSGAVSSLAAKRAAEEEALNVVGVQRVDNALSVQPSIPASDVVIRNDIQDALAFDAYLFDDEVVVAVSSGAVTLGGAVETDHEKKRAAAVAGRVAGVTAIENALAVPLPPPIGAPLADRIRERLRRSALVEADDIQVEVEDGVAALRGHVDSRFEASVAEDAAVRAGARAVVNELQIDYGAR